MNRPTLEALVAGLASVFTATVALWMVALMSGIVSRLHLGLMAASVVSAAFVAWVAHRGVPDKPFRLGAISAGVLALVSEVFSGGGFGTLQLIALVVAGAVAWGGVRILSVLTRPLSGWVAIVGLVAVTLVLARVVVEGGDLGHDESAYAVKARGWLEGVPDTGWSLHRGPLQSALAAIVLPFSSGAEALRSVSIVLSLGTVVAIWWLGRSVRSDRVGIAAAAVFAVAPSFLRRGAEFLTDVPSAGLLVVVAALMWRWGRRPESGPAPLLIAVVVGGAALYLRYQSLLSLGLMAVATVAVFWPRVRSGWRHVVVAAALGLALLVPHLIFAVAETGTPWGIVFATGEAGGREYVGEGLVDYARDLPDLLAGQIGALAIAVALTGAVVQAVAVARNGRTGVSDAVFFLMIPAVIQIVVMGLLFHGEPRFVFFPVALMLVAAALVGDEVRRSGHKVLHRVGAIALAMMVLVSLGLHGDRVDTNAEARGESFQVLVDAGAAIRADAQGPCLVVTGLEPQVNWFSACETDAYDDTADVDIDSGTSAYLLLAENGPRQPEGQVLEDYLALTEGDPIVIPGEGSVGQVEIWRVAG